ncbi:uncharacterized protein [Anoplolepis gracilipes]|uniref:uncharacterized protein isoform X1 n=1 Tax=Anoplolepis gracilipes TaxID=354296 RepID=UPI003BA3E100
MYVHTKQFRLPLCFVFYNAVFSSISQKVISSVLVSRVRTVVGCGSTTVFCCQFRSTIRKNMLKSYPTRFPNSGADGSRVIRLTVDQEAVLQEQFNRWPRTPYTADIVLLAAETGLSEADVEGWYAIRLAQWRKEQGLGGNLGLH